MDMPMQSNICEFVYSDFTPGFPVILVLCGLYLTEEDALINVLNLFADFLYFSLRSLFELVRYRSRIGSGYCAI